MIIIKLKGGLGNQLFQYAFGLLLASRRNEELKIDNHSLGSRTDTYRSYSLDNFNISASPASDLEIKRHQTCFLFLHKIYNKVFKDYHIGYEEKFLETKSSYIEGFFQSYKYLEPVREQLLKEISLKEDINYEIVDNSVAVHIRRGDYINNKAHFVCDLKYYQNAFKLIKEKIANPIFYIFSDDITWAKENLSKEDNLIFVSNPEIKDYEELILMSRCQHNIIANSSFSFWGAWLNQNPDKIVIAPDKWNNEFPNDYKDLLPPKWLKISTN